jgi:predicted acetyltransferase
MNTEILTLISPTATLEAAFWPMATEFDAAGERFWNANQRELAERDFAGYVALLEAWARGEQVPAGYVPSNIYWLLRVGTEIVGTSSLRHTLTPTLEDIGGHIGYNIRPSARRRGYGTRILALTLERARALGLERVLVTCNTDNVGSARIIQKNGGVLGSQSVSPASGKQVSRYWIALVPL